MNRPRSQTTLAIDPERHRWSLEVVRGRGIGREYELTQGETVVGNALGGEPGLDLQDQEGSSPRRMAGRHAALAASSAELIIRDLDSPGGTFVNQQRLLAGQARRLVADDVIQLGSVQLRVKQAASDPTNGPQKSANLAAAPTVPAPTPAVMGAAAAAPTPITASPPSPGRLMTPFVLSAGAQCRTWDDFLVIAAQNWPALCHELTSGGLAEYLRRIRRPDLVPLAGSSRSADDQLDDWLARIPTTASSSPELDVHPETLLVRAASGGGMTHQTLRITNVGYRLLRSTARVEPPEASWLRLRPEHDGQLVQTIDQTDVPVDLELPDSIDRPMIAHVVIESNGGTRRVAVTIERPSDINGIGGHSEIVNSSAPLWREDLNRTLGRVGLGVRLAAGAAGGVSVRLAAATLNKLPLGTAPGTGPVLNFSSLAIALVAAGMVLGLWLAHRRGAWRDFPAALFAGGSVGLLAAALWFALLQTVERSLGSWSSATATSAGVSSALGILVAVISLWMFPVRGQQTEVAP